MKLNFFFFKKWSFWIGIYIMFINRHIFSISFSDNLLYAILSFISLLGGIFMVVSSFWKTYEKK